MEKSFSAIRKLFFFFIALMSIMVIVDLFLDYRAAIIEGALTVMAAIAFFIVYRYKISKVENRQITELADFDIKKILDEIPTPIMIVGDYEDIIWVNGSFSEQIKPSSDCIGIDAKELIKNIEIKNLSRNKKNNISIDKNKYSVYVEDMKKCTILMFIDDTYYKEVEQIQTENAPTVAIISLDNREDLMNDSEGELSLATLANIENIVRKWVNSVNGLFNKLSDGKYVAVMLNKDIKYFSENNFTVLDEVRQIKLSSGVGATISVGIGQGGENFAEKELWAKQALEMALGRGGDQVIIKEKNSLNFFGGKSKGFEHRDRVRTRVISSMLSDSIKESSSVFIQGHRFSDLDSVGAASALWYAVNNSFHKPAYVVLNRDQSLSGTLIEKMESEVSRNIFITSQQAEELFEDKSLLIVVDTHSADFLEAPTLYDKSQRTVVIDHHRLVVNKIENPLIFYHDSSASSTSEMVTDLLRYMGSKAINKSTAQALLAGIILDTKSFILRTGVRTFEAAAYLRKKGADTVQVKRLFSDDMDTYKKKYDIVSKATLYNDNAIACVTENYDNLRVVAAQAADELLGIKEVIASFVLFCSPNTVNISARSLGKVNVQLIMEELGGGGHFTMAAAQLKDISLDEAKQLLIKAIDKIRTPKNK